MIPVNQIILPEICGTLEKKVVKIVDFILDTKSTSEIQQDVYTFWTNDEICMASQFSFSL